MSQINVAFLTEAGSKRGMGHLVRCYAIYEYFKEQGCKADFFLDSDVNYSIRFNNLQYFSWDKLVLSNKYDIAFIDSYVASKEIYKKISQKSKIAVYLDDEARLEYPKGVVLNFAYNAEDLHSNNNDNKYLLGIKYVPLRKTLLEGREEKKRQIFICLGGSDVKNLTYNIVSKLQDLNIPLVVIVNNEAVAKKIALLNNTQVLCRPLQKEFASSMQSSSIAITTASMTLYELCFLNIPAIVVPINDNQASGALEFLKHGLAYKKVDIYETNWSETLLSDIKMLLQSPFKPNSRLIDGQGCKRIYSELKELLAS